MSKNETRLRKFLFIAITMIAVLVGRELGFLWGLSMFVIALIIRAPVFAAEEDSEDSDVLPSWASAETLLSDEFRARSAIFSSICFLALLLIPYAMSYIDDRNSAKQLKIAQESGFVSIEQKIAFSNNGFETMQSFNETGFESLEQAIELKRFGTTKDQAIEAASELTPAEARECLDDRSTFELACQGKTFSWFVTPNEYKDSYTERPYIRAKIHEGGCDSRRAFNVIIEDDENHVGFDRGDIDVDLPIEFWKKFSSPDFDEKSTGGRENDRARCGMVIGEVFTKPGGSSLPIIVYEIVSIETDAELERRLKSEAELRRTDPFDVEGNIIHNSKFNTSLFRCVDPEGPGFGDFFIALFNRAIFYPSFYDVPDIGRQFARTRMSAAELAKDTREQKTYRLTMEPGNSIIFNNFYDEGYLENQMIASYSQDEVNYRFSGVRELGEDKTDPTLNLKDYYLIDRTTGEFTNGDPSNKLNCTVVPSPEPILERLYRRVSDYSLRKYEEAEAEFNQPIDLPLL